ncbi:MAG TPA: hypothetical protein VGN37_27210 [Actinocatenispora sp.]
MRRLAGALAAGAVGATMALLFATPALADTWESSGFHDGDICTYVGNVNDGSCRGAAAFLRDGDHLYVWDNLADGHSVVADYARSDTPSQDNEAWNHYGAGTRLDHNMDIPENGWIKYRVCLGEYSSRSYVSGTCSDWFTESAA